MAEETTFVEDDFRDAQDFAEMCASEGAYHRIDNWYPDIKEYTFPTKIIPLSLPEALVIKKHAERLNQVLLMHDLQNGRRLGQWTDADYILAGSEVMAELNENEKAELEGLEKRIDDAMAEYVASSGYAFIKLSTRSPKDSVFSLTSMKQRIEEDIKKSKFEGGTPEANAEDITIFVRATCQCLCVKNGAEAVNLLVRSKRVMTDLVFAELRGSTKDSIPMSIILREWDAKIHPEWEFRVFIFNNRLTAATQYTDILYVPEMAEKKAEIKEFIQNYWEKVKSSIKCDTYTMDLAIDPSLQSAIIVELNGPPPSAGCSLFNWKDPKDRAQIESGEEFELRIADKLGPNVRDEIHQPIRRYMDELRGIEPPNEFSYKSICCSSCRRFPITKTYFHCNICEDYDICLDCEEAGAHRKKDHGLKKLDEDGKEIPQEISQRGWGWGSWNSWGCVIN
eukprot:Phypoly_transcript_09379.p1 GENE.Phypoly_transcript_09379~~Phypoly_transcript_09379.p1  ORF type:complete len:451 (+),score=72.02 Phypoly_transcript_09379:18-1370(+)